MKIVLLIAVLASMAGLFFVANEARPNITPTTTPAVNQGAF